MASVLDNFKSKLNKTSQIEEIPPASQDPPSNGKTEIVNSPIDPIQPIIKGKKITVKIWSNDAISPNKLYEKEIPYGQPYLDVRFGKDDRRYKINYRTKGMIMQEGKKHIYNTSFNNHVGGLSFHEYPEEMDSSEVYDTHVNNGVDMYVKKGGIRPILLYICIGIIAVAMIGLIYFAQYALGLQSNNDINQKNLIGLSNKIDTLREQVKQLGGVPKV